MNKKDLKLTWDIFTIVIMLPFAIVWAFVDGIVRTTWGRMRRGGR